MEHGAWSIENGNRYSIKQKGTPSFDKLKNHDVPLNNFIHSKS
ncbi:MAG: hypothetical protein RLZ33_931 [Bacteroidota bacterium]|jgi:hypothetical protein